MKKIIFTVFGLTVFSTATQAQSFNIGPKVGANFSSLSGVEGGKSKTGYYFGAFAEVGFSGKFSIQPEVLYTAQGGKYSTVSNSNNSVETEINNSYVSVPIMLKYRLFGGLGLEFGPKFDFLTKSDTKLRDLKINSKDSYQSFNFGLGLGLSYKLPLGLNVDARYNFGLSKLNKNASIEGIPSSGENMKNDVFQIGIGYRFL